MLTNEQINRANAIKTRIENLATDYSVAAEERDEIKTNFQNFIEQARQGIIPTQTDGGEWNNTSIYLLGDIVKYGDNYYRALLMNKGKSPVMQSLIHYWTLYTYPATADDPEVTYPEWSSYTLLYSFKKGNKVSYNNKVYECTSDHLRTNLLPPTNITKWKEVN